jgi:hypothetical protein
MEYGKTRHQSSSSKHRQSGQSKAIHQIEPPVRFLKAGPAHGFSEDRLREMAVGETRRLA